MLKGMDDFQCGGRLRRRRLGLPLKQEASMLDASVEAEVAEYRKLKLDIAHVEEMIIAEAMRPERILYYVHPGRVVKVREGGTDWGWGVVVEVVKSGTLLPYRGITVNTLLHCSSSSKENGSSPKPCPPLPGEMGEMRVVPIQLLDIYDIAILIVTIPRDLRPLEVRQGMLLMLQEFANIYPDGLPTFDPAEDFGVEEPKFIQLVNQFKKLEQELLSHPLHKVGPFF